jgi:hypothetical protein
MELDWEEVRRLLPELMLPEINKSVVGGIFCF